MPNVVQWLALSFLVVNYLQFCFGKFDDWALGNKFCPVKSQTNEAMEQRSRFKERYFIYLDHPVYQSTLRAALAATLGGEMYQGQRSKLERESEFFGEVSIFCELLKHPSRTWDPSEASLFIVPAFPYLFKDATDQVAAQLLKEPTWQRSQGTDHLVVCTHWGCHNRLGPLFNAVALPGYIAALERNLKWLDPRLYRMDMDRHYAIVPPTPLHIHKRGDLENDDHPLCPERVVVLPYPPHIGIANCSQKSSGSSTTPRDGEENRRLRVFFAGTIRLKGCGELRDEQGTVVRWHRHDTSHGTRSALTSDALFHRYRIPSRSHSHSRSLSWTNEKRDASPRDVQESRGVPRVAVSSEQELQEVLAERGYYIQMFRSDSTGGSRIGGIGEEESGRGGKKDHGQQPPQPSQSYPDLVRDSHFCLHLRGDTPTSRRFSDAVAAGCLPIIVSDYLARNTPADRDRTFRPSSAMPFRRGGRVSYWKWVTFISEDAFAADPLGEIDKVMSRYFSVKLVDEPVQDGHSGQRTHREPRKRILQWSPLPIVEEMRRAMAADAPKLTLCSGTGAVGDEMLAEVFERMQQRRKTDMRRGLTASRWRDDTQKRNGNHDSSQSLSSVPPDQSCYARNAQELSDLYVIVDEATPSVQEQRSSYASIVTTSLWLKEQERLYGTNWTWCTEVTTPFVDYPKEGVSGSYYSKGDFIISVS